MTEGEPLNLEEARQGGVYLNLSSDGSTWRALLMDEVFCWLLCKRVWLMGRAACGVLRQFLMFLKGLALSSESRVCCRAQAFCSALFSVPVCILGMFVVSLALMRRGVCQEALERPADPGWEGLFGKRRLVIQSLIPSCLRRLTEGACLLLSAEGYLPKGYLCSSCLSFVRLIGIHLFTLKKYLLHWGSKWVN